MKCYCIWYEGYCISFSCGTVPVAIVKLLLVVMLVREGMALMVEEWTTTEVALPLPAACAAAAPCDVEPPPTTTVARLAPPLSIATTSCEPEAAAAVEVVAPPWYVLFY